MSLLDDVKDDLPLRVQDAVTFISSTMEGQWERAERYYRGETDLELFEGRSQVVKTEVRDAIRNTIPSIMRPLLQAQKIVEYVPSHPLYSLWVEQQATYVTQLFWQNDGYRQLLNGIYTAAKLKYGVMQTYWEPNPKPEWVKLTNVPGTLVQQLLTDQQIEIEEIEEAEQDGFYDVEYVKYAENGRIRFETVPNYEFFISEHCETIEQAVADGVHGHRRVITVSEALELGLEYDKWSELDAEYPELKDHGASSAARRNTAISEPADDPDPLKHRFLLTCVYYSCDLEDNDYTQLYRFYFGGSSYTYLGHEKCEESPYDLVYLNYDAHTLDVQSIADLTMAEQDAGTSILRATIDNAHSANNPRYAANPRLTNFDDLVNQRISAPIRTKEQIQVAAIPFTGQGLLGVLQYLDLDIQSKVGVTKAAQGLDPDALQSTDKQAVLNTIQTSQGQVELMLRNLVQLTLIPVFAKMFKLASRHYSPNQVVKFKGVVVPLDLRYLDPDPIARPNVGLGTASSEAKQAFLNFTLQRQEMLMEKWGPDNPFTSYVQMFNTIEDLGEMAGVYDIGRYFKAVTPNVEKMIAERMAKQAEAAQENAPADPGRVMLAIEQEKRQVEALKLLHEKEESSAKLLKDALEAEAKIDLERDRLIQERRIKLIEIAQQRENDMITQEQESNNGSTPSIASAVKRSQPAASGEQRPRASGQRSPQPSNAGGNGAQ